MIGHIDAPSDNAIINSTTFFCSGWVYSECGITSIKIIIDESDVGVAKYGLLRKDVKAVFPQYSNIEMSGFSFSKNLPFIKGPHKLKVTVYEKNGEKNDLGAVALNFSRKNIFKTYVSAISTHLFSKDQGGNDLLGTRKRISFRYLTGEGIEIGALHNPLSISDHVKIKYVDRLPSIDLQKHYSDLDPQQMVKIDLIDNGETLSTIADNSLDFIIANHFLEHCENPIGTIRNHLKKVKTGGILYYAIPEKTHTFDKERSLTEFKHLIEDDTQGPAISRKNHFYEWVTLVESMQDLKDIETRVSVLMAMDYSIHYHVWDIVTGFHFLYKTNEYLDNPFIVLHFEQNENEIITILQKR
jgi:predicted SAM-dependent methyltransferase